MYLLHFGWQ